MIGRKWRVSIIPDDNSLPKDYMSPEWEEHSRKFWAERGKEPPYTIVSCPSSMFDEVVISDWLHLEHMDKGYYWMRVGDARLDIRVQEDGKVLLRITRGEYGERCDYPEGIV